MNDNRFTMRPGIKAFETGLRHAYLAGQAKRVMEYITSSDSSRSTQKKQKIMPVIPKSYKKPYARRTVSKTKKNSSLSTVKKTILGMAATYHDTQSDQSVIVSATHNTIYTNNITAQVTQGTGNDNRQGDQIFMRGLNIRGSVFTNSTANAYQYRILVGYSGEEYNPGIAFGTGANGLAIGEIFLPNTGINFTTHGIINSKAFTVLYDQTLDVNSQIAATVDVSHVNIYVPLNQKFAYQSAASVYGKTKNLYVIAIGSVAGGTAGTTAAGVVSFTTDLTYKNL